jgi:hypothetical protein
LTGIDGFWTDDTPDPVKYKTVGKFEPKDLIWCAMTETGVSTPFIGTFKGQAVDTGFNEKHHKNDETIFWPDLAL